MIERMERQARSYEKFSMQNFRHLLRDALSLLGGGRNRRDKDRRREQQNEGDSRSDESGMTSMFSSGRATPAEEVTEYLVCPGGRLLVPNGHVVITCPADMINDFRSEKFWAKVVGSCLPQSCHPAYAQATGNYIMSYLLANLHDIVFEED